MLCEIYTGRHTDVHWKLRVKMCNIILLAKRIYKQQIWYLYWSCQFFLFLQVQLIAINAISLQTAHQSGCCMERTDNMADSCIIRRPMGWQWPEEATRADRSAVRSTDQDLRGALPDLSNEEKGTDLQPSATSQNEQKKWKCPSISVAILTKNQ